MNKAMSLRSRVALSNDRRQYADGLRLSPPISPTVLGLRTQDEARQRKAAAGMKSHELPIFTAAFVETMTAAEVAQLLNDCFYDLVRTERRLLLDRDYDHLRAQTRR